MATATIAAAQYLRMSTDLQQYSIENQKVVIRQYAKKHGFSLVKTYLDAARSGVILRRRGGLTQLLTDVLNGNAPFKAILVYDVSRWGRFQDADESAHYEFLCKKAGVRVHYCAELFPNDGTLTSSIFKALKRTMAAEYSRELGVKVFAAQKRLAQLGYRMGGRPVYGLRRFVESSDPQRELTLGLGQRKGLALDHVVLIPGPKNEIRCVRWIFALAAQNVTMSEIARRLNHRRIPYLGGREWTSACIGRTLRNSIYVGCSTWGRTTAKLHTPPVLVPRDEWITKRNAFRPIVSKETFERVQAVLKKRLENWSDEEMLGTLKRLLKHKGELTERIIFNSTDRAGLSTYFHRLGPFAGIYKQIGYEPPPGRFLKVERRLITRKIRAEIMSQVKELFPKMVTPFCLPGRGRVMIQFDRCIRISLIICRSCRMRGGTLGWKLLPIPCERDYMTLVCRLNKENDGIHSFLLFDRIEQTKHTHINEYDPWWKHGRPMELWELYKVAKNFWGPEKAVGLSA